MRYSMCCLSCETPVEIGWKVCPLCLCDLKDLKNTTHETLHEVVGRDYEEFLRRDKFGAGAKFVGEVANERLFDWKWAETLAYREGQWFVGKCYHCGILGKHVTAIDEEESQAIAAHLFEKAALQGLQAAQMDFGFCLVKGRRGLEANPHKALRWVELAAKGGYLHAKYKLHTFYQFGWGGPTNAAKSLEIIFEAAEEGFPPAQEHVGTLYRLGRNGLPCDKSLAMRWYVRAAESGYGEGYYGMAALYYYGEGVRKNKHQARDLFYKAASLGSDGAKRQIEVENKKMFPWGLF